MSGGSSRSTSMSGVPKWVEEAGKDIYGKAKSFYNSPYQAYSGQRVAGMTGDQTTGYNMLRDYVAGGGAPDVTGEVMQGMRDYGAAPASSVSTERAVDEGGRLGSISDYVNPRIAEILQPTIDAINLNAAKQKNSIGAMATGAGAFGDARHGILEAELGKNTARAIGEATSTAYSQAYDDAMARRTADLERMLGADTTNATLQETALNRGYQAAQGLGDSATRSQNDTLARLEALLSGGAQQQQQSQNQLDTQYEAYQAQQQDQYDRLAALMSVLGGVPYSRTTTTTTPDNSIWSAIGGLAGALF